MPVTSGSFLISELSVADLLNAVYQNDFFTGAGGSYPDYVFQKYFEGESSILPEYEFKSLIEVVTWLSTSSIASSGNTDFILQNHSPFRKL